MGLTASPGDLEKAMASIGYDGKDKNDDLNAVDPMTFEAFLELSKFHDSHVKVLRRKVALEIHRSKLFL